MPDSALDPPPSDVNSSRDKFVGEGIEKPTSPSAVEGDVPTEIRTKSPVDNEHRHTIGGKRYSMTPLMSNLTLDIDQTSDASLSVSEEGEHDDSDEEGYSDSVKSNLTDEESYAVSTSGSENEGSPDRLPFSAYAPSPSHSEASFDVTKDVTDGVISPNSAARYAAKTPKVKEMKLKKKAARRKRHKKKEDKKRHLAATTIRGLLLIRRARVVARFLRENPDLKKNEKDIVKIQSLLRGNSDRKKVAVINGDYVANAGLEVLKGQHNGERGLCEYIRKLEEENRQLLLDLANVNSMNLLTGPWKEKGKEEGGERKERLQPPGRRKGGKKQKWCLYKLDGDTGAYVEVKLGYAGLRRLDIIAEQNSVRKVEKEEGRKEREKRREMERREMEAVKREEDEIIIKKEVSPMEEVEAIEGRRGIEGDIEVEGDMVEGEEETEEEKHMKKWMDKEKKKEMSDRRDARVTDAGATKAAIAQLSVGEGPTESAERRDARVTDAGATKAAIAQLNVGEGPTESAERRDARVTDAGVTKDAIKGLNVGEGPAESAERRDARVTDAGATKAAIAQLNVGEGPTESADRRDARTTDNGATKDAIKELNVGEGPTESAERRDARVTDAGATKAAIAQLNVGEGPTESAERRDARVTDAGATKAAIAQLNVGEGPTESTQKLESKPQSDPSPTDPATTQISAPKPHIPPPKKEEEVDIVLQWRQSRGYGLGDNERKKKKKKKARF
ncbi:hypothetical protein TrCOL_g9946 [Triparma columacea]|uniref:Uncharacterized protein n=1 Tax=Triparma columacea TaxID=722753 RepID=A0A9W7L1D0_9STRA|nr:hypothetical protein TrCOL_g9946 [Triparma columacea]